MIKLFESTGLEDLDTMGLGDDSIVEIITADGIDTEVMTEAAEIEKEFALLDQVEETVTAMEQHAELMTGAIEAGDVNASTAKLAVAATTTHAVALGATADQLSVSFESAESDPAMTLKISLEEERGMIKKAIDGAKKLWVKLKKNVLKVVAKVISAVNGLKKKGKALESKIKESKKDMKGDYKSEVANAIRDKFKGAYLSGTLIKKGPKDLNDVIMRGLELSMTTNLTSFGDGALQAISTKQIKKSMKADSANVVLAKDLVVKNITDKKISKEISGEDGFSYIFRVDGANVKIFTTYFHSDEGDKSVRFRTDSLTITDGDAKKFDISLINKKSLLKIAEQVNAITSDMQSFVKNSFIFVDKVGDKFDEVADAAVGSDAGSRDANNFIAYKGLYTKSPSIAFGAVMGAYNTCKNSIYVINETIKAWENGKND